MNRDGQDHHLLVILKIKIRSSKKCDLEDQKSDHPNTVILKIKIKTLILKIKITLLLVLKKRSGDYGGVSYKCCISIDHQWAMAGNADFVDNVRPLTLTNFY